ncbi:hypothetical protein HDU98_006282 [Podochytrium sp. JEL0797]|nr:hypothetical protein HDU98_006282 [Podochytrium sp. JEL0797]
MLRSAFTGTTQVCTCLNRQQIQQINTANDPILKHTLPHETVFFAFKSTRHSHIFTDLAYIVIKGDFSTSTRRWVERFEYYEQAITDVRFETAGAGVTTGGRDVVISFHTPRGREEIDIWKNEIEIAHRFYKVIATLAQVQGKNRQLHNLSGSFASRVVLEKAGDVAEVAAKTAEALLERYSPRSYAKVFTELGKRKMNKLSSMRSALSATSQVCTCLNRKQIQEIDAANDPIFWHVLPHETVFFAFKSTRHSHIFTDLAYIVIKGDVSTSTRRWVERYEYYDQSITDVRFETGGTGITTGGRDVVISFQTPRGREEIDVWKNELEIAHKFYKVVATLAQVQGKNRQLLALSSTFAGKIVVEKVGDVAEVAAETAEKLVESMNSTNTSITATESIFTGQQTYNLGILSGVTIQLAIGGILTSIHRTVTTPNWIQIRPTVILMTGFNLAQIGLQISNNASFWATQANCVWINSLANVFSQIMCFMFDSFLLYKTVALSGWTEWVKVSAGAILLNRVVWSLLDIFKSGGYWDPIASTCSYSQYPITNYASPSSDIFCDLFCSLVCLSICWTDLKSEIGLLSRVIAAENGIRSVICCVVNVISMYELQTTGDVYTYWVMWLVGYMVYTILLNSEAFWMEERNRSHEFVMRGSIATSKRHTEIGRIRERERGSINYSV